MDLSNELLVNIKSTGNKNKNKRVGLYQIKKLIHSKENN